MPDPSEEEYLAERAKVFEWMAGRGHPVLTAGRLVEVLTQIIADHGLDVPVFSMAETEWVSGARWEPFAYEDGSGVNDWHGLSVTLFDLP